MQVNPHPCHLKDFLFPSLVAQEWTGLRSSFTQTHISVFISVTEMQLFLGIYSLKQRWPFL